MLLGLNDNRASSLTVGKPRHIGHGSHVCNEVGLVLAGSHQRVVHILLIKQQPLWHFSHACKQYQRAVTLGNDSSILQQIVTVSSNSKQYRAHAQAGIASSNSEILQLKANACCQDKSPHNSGVDAHPETCL